MRHNHNNDNQSKFNSQNNANDNITGDDVDNVVFFEDNDDADSADSLTTWGAPLGRSALFLAVMHRRKRLFRQLLEAGHRVDASVRAKAEEIAHTEDFFVRELGNLGSTSVVRAALNALRIGRIVFVSQRGELFESLGRGRWLDLPLLDALADNQLTDHQLHKLLTAIHQRTFFSSIVEFCEKILGWRYLSCLHEILI